MTAVENSAWMGTIPAWIGLQPAMRAIPLGFSFAPIHAGVRKSAKGAVMVKRILVPLDGSPFGEAILPQVRRLLMRMDAEVILFQSVYICPSFY